MPDAVETGATAVPSPDATAPSWVDIYDIQTQGDPWLLTLLVVLLGCLPLAMALGAYFAHAIPGNGTVDDGLLVLTIVLEGGAIALYPRMRVRQLTAPESVRMGKSALVLVLTFPRRRRDILYGDVRGLERVLLVPKEGDTESVPEHPPPAKVHWDDAGRLRTFLVPQEFARKLLVRLTSKVPDGQTTEAKVVDGVAWTSWTAPGELVTNEEPSEESPSAG